MPDAIHPLAPPRHAHVHVHLPQCQQLEPPSPTAAAGNEHIHMAVVQLLLLLDRHADRGIETRNQAGWTPPLVIVAREGVWGYGRFAALLGRGGGGVAAVN